MQDLTLVGVHDDGEHLVLAGAEGQRFRVRVDEPLRAAVRRDRPRLGQLQIEQDGRLRPRDIQARIRSGESAEQIAADSGVAIEHIRRYEGPVLAEREFVVRQARAVRLRGVSRLDGTVPTLGELVTERLAVREVEHGEGSWDAWRTEDGTWIVTLAFTAGTRQRQAQWAYNAQLRHVTAQDDEARWLTEYETPGSSPEWWFTDDWRRCAPPITTTAATSTSMTSRPTAGSARPSRPPPRGMARSLHGRPAGHAAGASWSATATTGRPVGLRGRRSATAAHPPRSRPDEAMDAEVLTLPESPVAVTISPVPAVKPASPGAPSAPAAAGAVSPVGVVKPAPVVAEPAAEAPTPPPPPPPRREARQRAQLGRHRLRRTPGVNAAEPLRLGRG